jgi:hypothetical protein
MLFVVCSAVIMSKKMAAKIFTVDLDKPLVFQVNMPIFNSLIFLWLRKMQVCSLTVF